MMNRQEAVKELNPALEGKTPEEILKHLLHRYGKRIALASSLGLEDQVLTDMILKIDRSARIFTIDTGRLFPETYSLIDKTNLKYGIRMEIFFPDSAGVEDYVVRNGINAFYESVEKRKECCRVRKIQPLLRALSTLDVWICGLRQEQSVTRTGVKTVEWDEANSLLKANPLVRWSEQDVWDYIKANHVPYNILHNRNYPSIGCQPCTRAVLGGEDVRAGRWWWENPEHKECGLHRR
ncbi:MAG: phosphoadenylyl-sulfate reductase [Dysgonamonadaceae bacterium]|jgi:phosphoadenosine phosphosulfate reductase|nr:phosphoadenylyl-sulfate reductase [Dysgonamonadaceae bacterium]